MLNILKSVQEYKQSTWYSDIEVSIGRNLKKAKGLEEEKNLFSGRPKNENNLIKNLGPE